MADFYPVLSRAISGLADNTPEARRAVYDRATTVLVAQLRGMNPPVSEADIARQRLALQEAITRIEREQVLPDTVDGAASDDAFQQEATPTEALANVEPVREESQNRGDGARPNGRREQQDPTDDADVALSPAPAPGRPRLDVARERPRRALPWRAAVVVGGVGLVVGAIAFTAFVVNQDQAAQTAPPAPAATPAQPTPGGKIAERAGDAPQPPAPSAPPAPQPAPAPPAPAAQTGATPAPAPAPTPGLTVAQRAVVYIEPADPSQPPRPVQGRVTWRVESGAATQGRRIETVLRADVDIAEIGLQLLFTIRRNEDAAFPASHIVGMRFSRTSDDGNGAVREAGVPQFKTEENERGAPLAGITSALGENLFVTALSRVEVELNRNLDVMRTRNWIDIPIRFASGRRAIIAFEKGVSGDQRMAEALRAWQP
jgi:hypothetical protein